VLADKLMTPGLQLLAIDQFKSIFNSAVPTLPSQAFIQSLYCYDKPQYIRDFLVGHFVCWLPKSAKKEDWLKLMNIEQDLVRSVRLAIIADAPSPTAFQHPADRTSMRIDGLDLDELKRQARKCDTGGGGQVKALGEHALLSLEWMCD
jgi:hypothetical protein